MILQIVLQVTNQNTEIYLNQVNIICTNSITSDNGSKLKHNNYKHLDAYSNLFAISANATFPIALYIQI